jgi:hypothetical protein
MRDMWYDERMSKYAYWAVKKLLEFGAVKFATTLLSFVEPGFDDDTFVIYPVDDKEQEPGVMFVDEELESSLPSYLYVKGDDSEV